MLVHPQFDPIAISIGPLSVRWYGLMYLAAFLQFLWLGRRRLASGLFPNWSVADIDDLLFAGVLGVVIGGRLGQVLFYEPAYYFAHPLEIFAVWKGGMSFHGGLIGVIVAELWFARKKAISLFEVADFVAPLVPLGLAFGRIGNFINGELWGRAADPALPWAMIFPQVDQLPRHPSPLYQAGLEGLTLFALLWWYAGKARRPGQVAGFFLAGYGVCRFLAEFFREPDAGIFGRSDVISMGQWLSLPMVALGLFLVMRRGQSVAADKIAADRQTSRKQRKGKRA